MSTSVRVTIAGWPHRPDESMTHNRPMFVNPVAAVVTAGGRAVGELDAHLQWDDDHLVARIALPSLPGHLIRAGCTALERMLDDGGAEFWIDSIDVTIDHDDSPVYRSFGLDAPPVPAQRARVVDERKLRDEDT